MKDTDLISNRHKILSPLLDEKARRLMIAAESKVIGRGSIGIVSKSTGVSRTTISTGLKELESIDLIDTRRIRKEGGGRKKAIEKLPAIEKELDKLIEPALRGEPDSPLMWTSKSLRKLSAELKSIGFDVSHKLVGEILKSKGFSLQANRKTDEGKSHPDRNAQFEHIHLKVKDFQENNQPVISVDAKKKELVGNFKNNGKEWHREKEPEKVKVYDFLSDAEGKAIPYGVYDLSQNKGWVSVGIDHDTAEFAVETIKKWWTKMGKPYYSNAQKLLITADGGGSNASRSRLWKTEIQKLSDETGLIIEVCHFPPATSKWNKIEHRLFSYISQNWRGKPLVSYSVIVNLIASTKTLKGLEIKCELDENKYDTGIKITDEE
ncbi:MAG: ISAzo13 family transposase, partial [Bacteroidota bacterium]|nr:ISAzo13 family transposase [Bacteroidota bacterium]